MSDLLNFILTSDDTLASHVMSSVDKFRQGQQIPQQQAQTIPQGQQGQKPQQFQKQQWKQQQPQQPIVINSAPKPPIQNGGFIRDMSVMPQAFYKL
jgi:hypothetical protein